MMKRPIFYIKNIWFSILKFLNNLFEFIKIFSNIILIISFFILTITIYKLGFQHDDIRFYYIQKIILFSHLVIIISFIIRLFFSLKNKLKIRIIFGELLFILLLSFFIVQHFLYQEYFKEILGNWYSFFENFYIVALNSIIFLVEFSKRSLNFLNKINPSLLFVASFLLLIILGTLLLMLPGATNHKISITDAFFTATSAVCVTGLTTLDTATTFTFFGKSIIMVLIQLGGLGVMTFTTFFGLFFTNSSSFKDQLLIKDLINSDTLSEIYKTLLKIILFTFIIESIGAILIWFTLDPTLSINSDNIKFSIFHSISAFCNAGFSTKSMGMMDPFISHNYLLHLVIAMLIILGGIGFPILLNYYKLFKHLVFNAIRILQGKRYMHKPHIININSRIVLITTFWLLIFGTVFFMIFEWNHLLKDKTLGEKLVYSFFASVTPRTAGFNTIDYSQILPVTMLLTMFLMWIGASPSGTGGGIKTSTFAIAILNIFSFAKGKDRIEVYLREISHQTVRKAFAIIFLSLIVIGIAIVLISTFNPELSFNKIIFECFSAYGTVGLSMGITPLLSDASKWVIIITMFLGRIGTLTIFIAFIRKVKTKRYKYPTDELILN